MTYLATFTGKFDFDHKPLGLNKLSSWHDLETESYDPEKWVLSHCKWRETSLFLFSFEYESPRAWAILNFLRGGKQSQLQHSSVSLVTVDVVGVASGSVGFCPISSACSAKVGLNCNTAQATLYLFFNKGEYCQNYHEAWN